MPSFNQLTNVAGIIPRTVTDTRRLRNFQIFEIFLQVSIEVSPEEPGQRGTVLIPTSFLVSSPF